MIGAFNASDYVAEAHVGYLAGDALFGAPDAERRPQAMRCHGQAKLSAEFGQCLYGGLASALAWEHQLAGAGVEASLLQRLQRPAAQRNAHRPDGLGALAGDRPYVAVDFAPAHSAHLGGAGCGQCHHPDSGLRGPVGAAAVDRAQCCGDFARGQRLEVAAFTGVAGQHGRQGFAGRVGVDVVGCDGPLERHRESLAQLAGQLGLGGPHRVENAQDIGGADLVDASVKQAGGVVVH